MTALGSRPTPFSWTTSRCAPLPADVMPTGRPERLSPRQRGHAADRYTGSRPEQAALVQKYWILSFYPERARFFALQLDAGAHDDRALAGELEVLGGVGRQPGGGDEQALAPAAHVGRIPGPPLDRGQEVGHVGAVARALPPA